MKTISLNFYGYCLDEDKAEIEDRAGIYCVYAGVYNAATDKVSPRQLLYIGKAGSLKNRIGNDMHDHFDDWESLLRYNETLMYTYAFISNAEDRTRAEAALIYRYQPPVNDIGFERFHHPETKIVISGVNDFFEASFKIPDDDE